MKLIIIILGCILTVKSGVASTDYTVQEVSGAWQHRETGKCVDFVKNSDWCKKHGFDAVACKPVAYMSDNCDRISTMNHLTRRVTDKETGKIYCYVDPFDRDVLPVNLQDGYLGLCDSDETDFYVRVTSDDAGGMFLKSSNNCWRLKEDADLVPGGGAVMKVVPNTELQWCYKNPSRGFRLLASGQSWFPFVSSIRADLFEGSYCPSNKRLCTAAEVCPVSPEHQSIIGVAAEYGTNSEALLVAGVGVLNAVTCKPIEKSIRYRYTLHGVVCCSNDKYPEAENFISNGQGYLVHKSGKCVDHSEYDRLLLKSSCSGYSSLAHWNNQGVIQVFGRCVGDTPFEGRCPPFQLTAENSLQNVYTGKCLMPEPEIEEDPELTEGEVCGEASSMFTFKKVEGFVQHSSTKCVAVDRDQLVLKSKCDSYDDIFYKETLISPIIHAVSRKCIKEPASDDETLSLTEDCKGQGANWYLVGDHIHLSGVSKCIQPQNKGENPPDGEKLVVRNSCSGKLGKFQFTEATFCSGRECNCLEGFAEHGGNCFPVNNCEIDNGGCQGNAECVYTGPGTSKCECPPGSELQTDGACSECPDKDCYKQCQFEDNDEIKTTIKKQERVKLRFLSFKTSDLQGYLTDETKEIVVFTHQLTVSGTLRFPFGAVITFFANEIVRKAGGRIELLSNHEGRRAVVKVSGQQFVCENHYSGTISSIGAVLSIYTSNTRLPFTCSANYNTRDLVRQNAIVMKDNAKKPMDVAFFSMVLDCAKVVAQRSNFAKDKQLLAGSLSVKSIQYVLDGIENAKKAQTGLTDSMYTLQIKATNLMEELSLRARGIFKVPYLSLKAQESILTLLKDNAKLAISKYERFERISQDFETRIESMDSMTSVMTAIVKQNDLDIEALEKEYTASDQDRIKMKSKLNSAKRDLEKAREIFESGVKDYKNKMIANAVFSVIGGVASMFAGGAGGVLGFTLALGDLAEDVSKLSKTLFKISIILDAISGINDAATTFNEVHFDVLPYSKSDASAYYSQSLPKRNGQSLSVMIKEWDVFEANAEAFLGIGTAANDISGTSDYLAALKTVAVWGRAYHERTMLVEELMATIIKLKTLKLEQDEAQTKITEFKEIAVRRKEINGDLLFQMSLQKQRLRNIMVDKLMSFCDSYFYSWVSECPVMPTMSDDLYSLHEKVNLGLSSSINAVENFAPVVPQTFEETIVIKDDKECKAFDEGVIFSKRAGQKRSIEADPPVVNTIRCPLSSLKLTNSFLYHVNVTDGEVLLSHERVHVDEVEVYLKGATCECEGTSINAHISFIGIMKHIFEGKEYEFLSAARLLEFSYKIKQGDNYEVTKAGKVSEKFQEYYDGIAALTTWSIDVPKDVNHKSLDLTGVTEVWLKFKGVSILASKDQTKMVKSESSLLLENSNKKKKTKPGAKVLNQERKEEIRTVWQRSRGEQERVAQSKPSKSSRLGHIGRSSNAS